MNDLVRHVEASIGARRLFARRERILVAVSGGVDSMALLHVLFDLAPAHDWQLTVAHFNHRLRGAAATRDAQLVRRVSARLKLRFIGGQGNVKAFAQQHGLSLEMGARHLRHGFLTATAVKSKVRTVALAHHADDQVELFFLRLLRGAGGEGLAGMKWQNPSPFAPQIRLARPLLDVPKKDLEEFARDRKIPFSVDATNACLDLQRNRVRHELIPLLTTQYQPALSRSIPRVMDLVGAEAEFAAETARRWLDHPDQSSFAKMPVAVQRQVVRHELLRLNVVPEFELVERLRLHDSQWFAVGSDVQVARDPDGRLRKRGLEATSFSGGRMTLRLSGPEREVCFGGVKIQWAVADSTGKARDWKLGRTEWFDADKVGDRICLRNWQPGDRFQPIGTGAPRKLQDLFTNLKVPRAERHQRVVASTQAGELFWVEGLRMAERFKLDENTSRTLKWRWQRLGDGVSSQLRFGRQNVKMPRGTK